MKLREYQVGAVEFVLPRARAFVVAPAGSGKTIMAAAAAARKAEPFDRVCWLANTREQVEQARAACLKAKWPDPVDIHICCVASKPDVSGARIVIVDESHHLPAKSWWSAISPADQIVWGFSATPWSGDWERDGILKAFFGEENFVTIPREEVMQGGSITKGHVIIHDVDTEGQFNALIASLTAEETVRRFKKMPYIPRDEHERRVRWQFTVEALRENETRNARIIQIAFQAIEAGESVLILVSTIEHGQRLAAQINAATLVHAKIGRKARKAAIDAFRAGQLRCMIATSLADEGLDVPCASVLILAAGGRSAGKLEQRAGRVMRPSPGKEYGIVHDFTDRGASMAFSQFKARMRTYKRLGYSREEAA